jgi:hypothetical protein
MQLSEIMSVLSDVVSALHEIAKQLVHLNATLDSLVAIDYDGHGSIVVTDRKSNNQ